MKKTVVRAENTKYFVSQEEARKYTIKLLEAGLTFVKVYEDEDD